MDDILIPNTQRELLRLILNSRFYEANKDSILPEMFASNLKPIFNIIVNSHEKHHKDLTLGELKALYRATHPTTTTAQWGLLEEVLDNLPTEISDEVAKEVLKRAWTIERGRQIAEIGINIANKGTADFTALRKIMEKIEQGSVSDETDLEAVSSELEDVLDAMNVTTKWGYYLEPLNRVCPGMGPGIFTIIAGRPESGKSQLAISMIAAPGGFAEQGALCHYYANEEDASRMQARAIMCYTGMTLQELSLYPDKGREVYANVRKCLRFYNCRDRNINEVGKHIAKCSPDISIVDQLDKLQIGGTFTRSDEQLGALYAEARNVGNRFHSAMVALTQLNAEAEDKTYLTSSNLSNARTAKSAEGDVVIGIGKMPGHQEHTRILNFIKNKINSNHTDVICMSRPEISRFIA